MKRSFLLGLLLASVSVPCLAETQAEMEVACDQLQARPTCQEYDEVRDHWSPEFFKVCDEHYAARMRYYVEAKLETTWAEFLAPCKKK